MIARSFRCCLAALALCGASWPAMADTIRLANGDSIKGKVVSLDVKQLVIQSESFGELKLARDKVDLIVLGDKPLPSAQPTQLAPVTKTAPTTGQLSPIMQLPETQEQLGPLMQQLLGAGGVGDLQQNVDTARKGLMDLKKDFGEGPESQAIDAYINMFNLFSTATGGAGGTKPVSPPKPSTAPTKPSTRKPAPVPAASPSSTKPDRAKEKR